MKNIEFLINELKEELIQELEKKCKPHYLNIYSPDELLKKENISIVINDVCFNFLKKYGGNDER